MKLIVSENCVRCNEVLDFVSYNDFNLLEVLPLPKYNRVANEVGVDKTPALVDDMGRVFYSTVLIKHFIGDYYSDDEVVD